MNKLEYAQRQVSEVTEVMRQNVAKVMERDDNLAELESKAGDLVMGASQFQTQSTHLKRKMWWKNMKFMMAVGGGCVLQVLRKIRITIWGGNIFCFFLNPVYFCCFST